MVLLSAKYEQGAIVRARLSSSQLNVEPGYTMVLNIIFRLLQINLTTWNGWQCHINTVSLPRSDLDSQTVICGQTFNTWVVTQIEGL